ncbi:MAG: hypothetical protein ABIH34_04025 [Nanoarchaeota archaeon]
MQKRTSAIVFTLFTFVFIMLMINVIFSSQEQPSGYRSQQGLDAGDCQEGQYFCQSDESCCDQVCSEEGSCPIQQ